MSLLTNAGILVLGSLDSLVQHSLPLLLFTSAVPNLSKKNKIEQQSKTIADFLWLGMRGQGPGERLLVMCAKVGQRCCREIGEQCWKRESTVSVA